MATLVSRFALLRPGLRLFSWLRAISWRCLSIKNCFVLVNLYFVLVCRAERDYFDRSASTLESEVEYVDRHSFYYDKHTQRELIPSYEHGKDKYIEGDNTNGGHCGSSDAELQRCKISLQNRPLSTDIADEILSRRFVNMLLSRTKFKSDSNKDKIMRKLRGELEKLIESKLMEIIQLLTENIKTLDSKISNDKIVTNSSADHAETSSESEDDVPEIPQERSKLRTDLEKYKSKSTATENKLSKSLNDILSLRENFDASKEQFECLTKSLQELGNDKVSRTPIREHSSDMDMNNSAEASNVDRARLNYHQLEARCEAKELCIKAYDEELIRVGKRLDASLIENTQWAQRMAENRREIEAAQERILLLERENREKDIEIQEMQKVIKNFSLELVDKLLGHNSALLKLRFINSIAAQNASLGVYHSLLGLKNILLLQEAYRYILADFGIGYRLIVHNAEELVVDNPLMDVEYKKSDAQTVVIFLLRALTDLANASNSIIGMWALKPSILEILAAKLRPYDRRLSKANPLLQYSILYLLYAHCSRYNHFVRSSSLITGTNSCRPIDILPWCPGCPDDITNERTFVDYSRFDRQSLQDKT